MGSLVERSDKAGIGFGCVPAHLYGTLDIVNSKPVKNVLDALHKKINYGKHGKVAVRKAGETDGNHLFINRDYLGGQGPEHTAGLCFTSPTMPCRTW